MGKSMWKIVEEHGPLVEALPFSENEYERRLRSLRNAMRLRGLDAFITFTPENIYYITGHDSPGYYFYEASIVTTDERPVNILRTIEATVTHWRSWSRRAFAYQDRDDPVEVTIALFDQLGVLSKNIGMESESFFVTPKTHAALKSAIGQYGGKVHDAQLIEPLRVVKSGEELEYVRRGARVAECAMRAAIDASAAGVSENYIAGAMWQAMASAGGQYAGLPPFITSGKRTSLCHATWAGRSVEP
ncbi:MAG: M24 family metallopeptidase, partial [Alphaproteobacteria bacterium]